MQKGKKFLSDLKLHSDYFKWMEDKGRYETWEDACEDLIDGHKKKYEKQKEELSPYLDSVLESMKDQVILASQRNLQYRYPQIMKHNTRMFNCFSSDTEFITDKGVVSFKDLTNGDVVNVWTHNGRWRNGVVKSYGVQQLNKVTFNYNGSRHTVKVTPNHRWILKNGEETTSLKIGDIIIKPKEIYNFDYDNATPFQKLYWCYGYVFGDGTKVMDKNKIHKHSMVRLCGDQVKYAYRFEEMGFKSSSPLSINGDLIFYTGKYLKTEPNLSVDDNDLIQGFITGYLDADAEKNRNPYGKKYNSILTSNEDNIEFLRRVLPTSGFFIMSEKDLTGQVTNYGTRPKTSLFTITERIGSKFNTQFIVEGIEKIEEDIVWCLEVEDDNSFTLPNGIVTGNCTSGHVVRNKIFQEIFYLALSGCGFGGGILIPFIKNLSKIKKRNLGAKTYVISDSIEGWANALGVLMSSYFVDDQPFPDYAGYVVKFDYSQIREKGSYISGGFKAPGAEGLKQSLENIEELLNVWLEKEGNTFRPILAFDIICHSADAVLSGGVRRSALNMIVDPNDDEMIHAKTGNWRTENPQRGRSNNSVLLLRGEVTKEKFEYLIKLNDGSNDIGFVFANSWFDMFNPCVSFDSLINTPNGLYFPEDLNENKHIVVDSMKFDSTGFIQTGVKPVYEIETIYGRKIKVTSEHVMFTSDGMIQASQLIEGDELIISNNTNVDIILNNDSNDYKIGYLVGAVLGDGNFSNGYSQIKFWGENNSIYHNTCLEHLSDLGWSSIKKEKLYLNEDKDNYTLINSKELYEFINEKDSSIIDDKRLSKKLLSGNFNYINGIISGYFDADGSVLYNKEKGNSIRIVSTQIGNLENIQIALNAFGVYSKLYFNRNRTLNGENLLPDSHGGLKKYDINDSHELVITKESMVNFNKLGFINNKKRKLIEEILSTYKRNFYKTQFKEKIKKITYNTESVGVFDCSVQEGIEKFECNGFVVHNCFEILKIPILMDIDFSKIKYNQVFNFVKENKDKFGIQGCNLSEINAEKCTTKEKFLRACKDASIIGTLQAGYTDFPYLGKTTKKIFEREALLGVSITGWMNNPKLFNPELLKEGANVVKETNKEISNIIKINQAARTTCVKPSGNASVILGTASGIHPEHSEKYFRIMQLNKESNSAKWLEKNMSFLLEESVWSNTKSDYVVFVPIENPKNGLFKKDVKGVKHLEFIKLVQENWVNAGTNKELCVYDGINHNTSCTVIIDNKDEIINYIWDNKDYFTAVSFISDYGDKDFNQAPFTSVLTLEEIVNEYGKGSILASGLVIDGLHYFDNNLWLACDTLLSLQTDKPIPVTGTREQVLLKNYWLARAKKFSKNYYKGDIIKMVYCLKDIHLFHKWETVIRQFKEVNFGEILDKPEFKDISDYASMACAGGSCEITRI